MNVRYRMLALLYLIPFTNEWIDFWNRLHFDAAAKYSKTMYRFYKHHCPHTNTSVSSLKSQVVYSKQPKLGLTQEFVVDCAHALWVVRSIKRLV